jgi:hypothetical protein
MSLRVPQLLPAALIVAAAVLFPNVTHAQLIYDGGASVRVQVTPKQTEVYIDNYYVGTVDNFDGMFQRLHIPPGPHDVTLYLEGYRTVHQRIYIQPTGTFRLRYNMVALSPGETPEPRPVQPAQPAGPIGPPQAGPTGPPPVQGPPVPYPPAAPPAGPGRFPPPRAASDSGTLSIRVQPANAEVLIDGERWDGPGVNDRLDVQVSAGTHHIEVRHDGYRGYETEVIVRPGEASPINVSLTRQ